MWSLDHGAPEPSDKTRFEKTSHARAARDFLIALLATTPKENHPMNHVRRLLPSPAMAVAVIALCVALSGTAYAAAKISGKNIKNRSIAGSKMKKNTLGSNEIKESSIASKMPTVPSATNATNATNATRANTAAELDGLVKFGAAQGLDTAETDVYNSGKLRLTQACDGAGALLLRAYTAVDNASIFAYGNGSDTSDGDFDISENPKTVSQGSEERDLVYSEPGGQFVAAQFLSAEQPDVQSTSCLVRGIAQVK